MPIEHAILRKAHQSSPETYAHVEAIALQLLQFMNAVDVQERIAAVHQFGASSRMVQDAILPGARTLGFAPEKTGLFQDYQVAALRPDYYLRVGQSGILLEVERGKTTTNNMDLLDLWKCHLCHHADYLFLLVPQARPSANGTVIRHFKQVQKRLGTFFIPINYVNVDAVFLYGY